MVLPFLQLGVSEVGSSLLALSVAGHAPDGVPLVTPNLRCRCLSTGGVINRLWEWFFEVMNRYGGAAEGYRQQCLMETLLKTHDAFRQQVDKVIGAYQQYSGYLQQMERGVSLDSSQLHAARMVISDWNEAMRPPEGWTLEQMIYKANQACALLMQDARRKGWQVPPDFDTLLSYRHIYQQIEHCQGIIDFEEETKSPLPFAALRKLCYPYSSLGIVDADTVKRWIFKINNCVSLTVRELHLGMKSVAEQMGMRHDGDDRPTPLAFLEYHLKQLGLTLLDRPDPEHLLWRAAMEKELKATVGGKPYILENRLGAIRPSDVVDRHVVYSIAGNKKAVLVSGINEAALGMEAAEIYENRGFAPLAAMQAIDPSGRVALVERLSSPLGHTRWHSRGDSLDKGDRRAADALVNLLKELAHQEKTPLIHVHDLMFTSKGELRLVRKVKEGSKYDFDRLVRLAYEASARNLTIFKHLLKESGLAQHDLVTFYQDVVKDALLGAHAVGVDEVAGRRGLSDALIRARGKKLSKDVAHLMEWCYSELTLNRDIPAAIPREQIERQLKGEILACYNDSIGAGILWPDLGDRIVVTAAAGLGLR